jgi:hypothetical protein
MKLIMFLAVLLAWAMDVLEARIQFACVNPSQPAGMCAKGKAKNGLFKKGKKLY